MKRIILAMLLFGFISFASHSFAYDECNFSNPFVPCSYNGFDFDGFVGNSLTDNGASRVFFNSQLMTVVDFHAYDDTYTRFYDPLYGYACMYVNSGTFPYWQETPQFFGESCVSHNLGYYGLGAGIPAIASLTITRSPEAGGGVASLDEAETIQCGVNSNDYCEASLPLNSEIELQAFPSSLDYAFAYWLVGTTQYTDNPHTFVMSEGRSVTAVFKPEFTFPLYGYSPTTVPISAVMDHSVFDHTPVQFYQTDDIVKAFNGEIGDKDFDYLFISGVWGYTMNEEEDTFLSGYNYTEGRYLFYDGHAGFDFAVSTGTDVLAPFSGKLYWSTTDLVNGNPGTYGTFYIDHENGYTTWFLHCSGLTSAVATEVIQNGYAVVAKGDHVAESSDKGAPGSYHLHFEVRKGGVDDENVIDPYKEGLWE